MKNTVLIVWLEGMRPENFAQMPFLKKLAATGVDVRLRPLPLFEKRVNYYQAWAGIGSGKSGIFDSVYPKQYVVYPEHQRPEGPNRRLLPEILQVLGVETTCLESNDPGSLNTWLNPASGSDCTIIRISAEKWVNLKAIDTFVQSWELYASPASHLLLFADAWYDEPAMLVNVNDFLVDKGLMAVKSKRKREDILWTNTLAYGAGTGQIWINLAGREPQGLVNAGMEYHETREALFYELGTNWCDPLTCTPIVERIFRKEEAYSGEYLFRAPDLILTYRPGYMASPRAVHGDFDGMSIYQIRSAAPIQSTPYARLIGGGPSLTAGLIEEGMLVDFVPTVLYLLGLPIPNHLDGNVLHSLFTPLYCQQHNIQKFDYVDHLLSRREEEMVVDRLRNLGYLG